ncbi:MAG TPA: DUF1778 domain-containing protein [Nocardioides sp.]|jgi:uncharacterized protein (DUF1778 family)|uniref:type II toxin-antitoxin system TacA family antitoxin n=1 Tax=Nocardioides sp. TaxID=35761 RepID=UPI002E37CC40|nr:DUF1778 domain-containing protein [Nocardioides sp.]HEX3930032.1 DUF1778 domain-containing protein [Nocardioides sp.]
MRTASTKSPKARLEARIDADLDHMIEEAAQRLHLSKTAFITQMLREASVKVIARADLTLMDPAEFDRMVASLDVPDESPELEKLFSHPTQIAL